MGAKDVACSGLCWFSGRYPTELGWENWMIQVGGVSGPVKQTLFVFIASFVKMIQVDESIFNHVVSPLLRSHILELFDFLPGNLKLLEFYPKLGPKTPHTNGIYSW